MFVLMMIVIATIIMMGWFFGGCGKYFGVRSIYGHVYQKRDIEICIIFMIDLSENLVR